MTVIHLFRWKSGICGCCELLFCVLHYRRVEWTKRGPRNTADLEKTVFCCRGCAFQTTFFLRYVEGTARYEGTRKEFWIHAWCHQICRRSCFKGSHDFDIAQSWWSNIGENARCWYVNPLENYVLYNLISIIISIMLLSEWIISLTTSHNYSGNVRTTTYLIISDKRVLNCWLQ